MTKLGNHEDKGMKELLDTVVNLASEQDGWAPLDISYGNELDGHLDELIEMLEGDGSIIERYPARWLAIKLLEQDEQVQKLIMGNASGEDLLAKTEKVAKHMHDTFDDTPEGLIADHRYGFITGICRSAVQRTMDERLTLSDKADKVLINRTFGPFFLAGIIFVADKFI